MASLNPLLRKIYYSWYNNTTFRKPIKLFGMDMFKQQSLNIAVTLAHPFPSTSIYIWISNLCLLKWIWLYCMHPYNWKMVNCCLVFNFHVVVINHTTIFQKIPINHTFPFPATEDTYKNSKFIIIIHF